MDESQEILMNSLESSGISIPPSVSSLRDLDPNTLVSICAQCLNLLDHTASFPTFLPDGSMATQVKICSDIASGIKNLGYIGDMSFHKVSQVKKWRFWIVEFGWLLRKCWTEWRNRNVWQFAKHSLAQKQKGGERNTLLRLIKVTWWNAAFRFS